MKKLRSATLAFVLTGISLVLHAQKTSSTGSAYSHQARFSVYDYNTKAPIEHAVVVNEKGAELGFTNVAGDLALNLPPNTSDYYTIRAEGYNPFNIRLTQAEKRTGDYEVFLPEARHQVTESLAIATLNESMQEPPQPELVKVYVKQDPVTYKKQNDEPTSIDFSVQVAASSKTITEYSARNEWEGLGPVYVQNENGVYKVRIGPFDSQIEAKKILVEVKSKGRKDAFIVVRQGIAVDKPITRNTPEIRTNESPKTGAVDVQSTGETKGDYKVRVASYLHPGDFNTEGIDNLGTLESYRKGEWTIMMISGFNTLESARKAQKIVVSKGFNDAAVVMERDGLLETIQ
ncbi:MAG: SPOR domain-containing protein [Bacteroidota bacterium]|nr:SPOR domain-containing protein [Bacteroidota bacterium]